MSGVLKRGRISTEDLATSLNATPAQVKTVIADAKERGGLLLTTVNDLHDLESRHWLRRFPAKTKKSLSWAAPTSAGQAALHFAGTAGNVTLLVRGDGLSATMSKYLIDEISSNIQYCGGGWHADPGGSGGRAAKCFCGCFRPVGGVSVTTLLRFSSLSARLPVTAWLPACLEAAAASETSIRLAMRSKHAPNLALAYGWATFLHLCTRDLEALRSLTPKLIAHCEEHGFPHWLALGKIGHGWCLARTGDVAHGLDWLRAGIEEFRSLWGGFLVSACLVCLADACGSRVSLLRQRRRSTVRLDHRSGLTSASGKQRPSGSRRSRARCRSIPRCFGSL